MSDIIAVSAALTGLALIFSLWGWAAQVGADRRALKAELFRECLVAQRVIADAQAGRQFPHIPTCEMPRDL
jgi:hypothetical protein